MGEGGDTAREMSSLLVGAVGRDLGASSPWWKERTKVHVDLEPNKGSKLVGAELRCPGAVDPAVTLE